MSGGTKKKGFAAKTKPVSKTVANLLDGYIDEGPKESKEVSLVDPITFCEAEWGLQLGMNGNPSLFPVQKFILKVYYGMELDDQEKCIPIRDKFNEILIATYTEVEFYEYLKDLGTINKPIDALTGDHTDLILAVGRRGSKTSIVSFVVCYELYCMLSRWSPHEYFGIILEDLIEITSISTNEKNAQNLFDRVVGNLERSKFFKPYMYQKTQLEVYFQSQRDIDLYGEWERKSIKLRAAPCSGSGLRGPNNIIVVFDEAAFFFRDDGSSGKAVSNKSDKAVYEAATPSVAGFAHPDGRPAGRVIMISSPADKSGLFYEMVEESMHPDSNTLMLRMPTWVMNPSVSSKYLKGKYRKNPKTYMNEFGAEFSDQMFGWLDDANQIWSCVDPGRSYKEVSYEKVPHFLGLDPGFKEDGTALAIVHPEFVKDPDSGVVTLKFVLDYCKVHYPWDEGVDQFEDTQIEGWIVDLYKKFKVQAGLSDQYYKFSLEPKMQKRGIKTMEFRHMSSSVNSTIYQNLMAKMVAHELVLPSGPKTDKIQDNGTEYEDTELVKEILSLQATYQDKYTIKVSAPKRKGAHDDLSDAYARAVMIATEYVMEGKLGSRYSSIGGSTSSSALAASARRSEISKALNNRSATPLAARPGYNMPGMRTSGLGSYYRGLGGGLGGRMRR